MQLRQGDLSLSKLVVVHQSLVDQDVLGLHHDKSTLINLIKEQFAQNMLVRLLSSFMSD